jgi:histidyl-tRNA synthetase
VADAGIAYEHDARLVRGLDYYTRTAFEFISGSLPQAQAATICGGGRYDGLAEVLGGPATPGVGFGMGLDRVLLAMEAEGAPVPSQRVPTCFVVAIGDAARSVAARLVGELRDAGVATTTSLEERPMNAQFRMADRAGAAFVAVIGDRELERSQVTIRRLADGVQKEVPAGDVVNWLTRLEDPMR